MDIRIIAATCPACCARSAIRCRFPSIPMRSGRATFRNRAIGPNKKTPLGVDRDQEAQRRPVFARDEARGALVARGPVSSARGRWTLDARIGRGARGFYDVRRIVDCRRIDRGDGRSDQNRGAEFAVDKPGPAQGPGDHGRGLGASWTTRKMGRSCVPVDGRDSAAPLGTARSVSRPPMCGSALWPRSHRYSLSTWVRK